MFIFLIRSIIGGEQGLSHIVYALFSLTHPVYYFETTLWTLRFKYNQVSTGFFEISIIDIQHSKNVLKMHLRRPVFTGNENNELCNLYTFK